LVQPLAPRPSTCLAAYWQNELQITNGHDGLDGRIPNRLPSGLAHTLAEERTRADKRPAGARTPLAGAPRPPPAARPPERARGPRPPDAPLEPPLPAPAPRRPAPVHRPGREPRTPARQTRMKTPNCPRLLPWPPSPSDIRLKLLSSYFAFRFGLPFRPSTDLTNQGKYYSPTIRFFIT
jgi:hypothetical protein